MRREFGSCSEEYANRATEAHAVRPLAGVEDEREERRRKAGARGNEKRLEGRNETMHISPCLRRISGGPRPLPHSLSFSFSLYLLFSISSYFLLCLCVFFSPLSLAYITVPCVFLFVAIHHLLIVIFSMNIIIFLILYLIQYLLFMLQNLYHL